VALLESSSLADAVPLEGWSFAASEATKPDDLGADLTWLPLAGPLPVAAGLEAHGQFRLDDPRSSAIDLDRDAWWYRCAIPRVDADPVSRAILRLGGLATLADVFVDGQHLLRSDNMFHAHRLDLSVKLRAIHRTSGTYPSGGGGLAGAEGPHELAIRFAPLAELLAVRRPAPRWNSKLVSRQELRFLRTSLVGRTPGRTPPIPCVGPWRPVVLHRWRRFVVHDVDVRTELADGAGIVHVTIRGTNLTSESVKGAVLTVGSVSGPLEAREDPSSGDAFLWGTLTVPKPELWWPHTHGEPVRHPAAITLEIGGTTAQIALGRLGFRAISLDTTDGAFALRINGERVFCRGAAWTTTDVTRLAGSREDYLRVLGAMKDAGMNMVRVPGTMAYETDAFYEACDELGLLVWQDFMFANMDYPFEDGAFRTSVVREAGELLGRLQARPSLAVICGGAEVEREAAVTGAPRAAWKSPLFEELLADECRARCPSVPYWPNTPSGGVLPLHADRGVSHYHGVGQDLRTLDDPRRADVRFAAECLAFANVPESDLFASFLPEGEAPIGHARWKERTTRHHGASWDLEDVRDHYVAHLFGVDPSRQRHEDIDRYLALARAATGEVMARVFAELRRPGSRCSGALVFWLQDLWAGAGAGILDSRGLPKSPFWYLRRVLGPTAGFFTDEGVNGLHIHLLNDGDSPFSGRLGLSLYRDGEAKIAGGSTEVVVPARAGLTVPADALLDTFADTSRAHPLGRRAGGHDVAEMTLSSPAGAILCEAVHVADLRDPPRGGGLEARLVRRDQPAEGLVLHLRTKRFAQSVSVTVPGYVPVDNYFDLAPGAARSVMLRPLHPNLSAPVASVAALNLAAPLRVVLEEAAP
jgi:beta-mannosidase